MLLKLISLFPFFFNVITRKFYIIYMTRDMAHFIFQLDSAAMEMEALFWSLSSRRFRDIYFNFTFSDSESHLNFDITQPINLGTTNIRE